jgi:hypothetical protein
MIKKIIFLQQQYPDSPFDLKLVIDNDCETLEARGNDHQHTYIIPLLRKTYHSHPLVETQISAENNLPL